MAGATTANTVAPRSVSPTALSVLLAVALAHGLNDAMQSLLPAIYPTLKANYRLSFAQIGFITLAFQVTASLLQPLVGAFTDRRPQPGSLPVAMAVSFCGLAWLGQAGGYVALVAAAALLGLGSAIFHPEASRVARLASGGRYGLAQSTFQTGGNSGSSLGPLLAAFVVTRFGQGSVSWFAALALTGIALLTVVGRWYGRHLRRAGARVAASVAQLSRGEVRRAMAVLLALVFSKYLYLSSINNYLTFFMIGRFGISVRSAQLHLFAFLFAVAVGTLIGGPVGDRWGRRMVIWVSILGVLPFTLLLPHANLFWSGVLTVAIGFVLSSAFSAIIVYAQELVPGRVGTVAGLFFGAAFGMGGLGAAALGWLADRTSLNLVYNLCAFLPALGLLTAFLPDVERVVRTERQPA